MEVALAQQTRAFFYAALLGLCLGLLYDFFRAVRIAAGNHRLLTGFLDLVFCLAVTISFFVLTLVQARGQVRSYTMVGMGLGGLLYFCGLSPFALALLRPLGRFVHRLPGLLAKIFKKIMPKPRKKP